MPNTSGSFIVAWDFSNGEDNDVLIVGSQHRGGMDIINAFQGREARDIYEKLTRGKNNHSDGTVSPKLTDSDKLEDI